MLYGSEEIMKFKHTHTTRGAVAVKGKMMNGEIVYKSS
jgi:hypothetical protein